MTELKPKALFIGGTAPEIAVAAAMKHHITDVDCSSRIDLDQYWKGALPFSIRPRYAATHLLPDKILAEHPTNYDAVYLLEPTPELVEQSLKLLKPGAWVLDANGVRLKSRVRSGMTADMNNPIEFIKAFGHARYGTTEWIGPTARDLGVNPKFIADCISGKSYLKPDNSIISAAARILDEDIARLQAARQKAPT